MDAPFIEALPRVSERFDRVRVGYWIHVRHRKSGLAWWEWSKDGDVEKGWTCPDDDYSSLGVSEVGIHDTVAQEKSRTLWRT
jgi:hypothetical protein